MEKSNFGQKHLLCIRSYIIGKHFKIRLIMLHPDIYWEEYSDNAVIHL